MSGMMNWQQLLSDARWGSRHQSTASPQKNRSNYDRDYGRILFSSAFRRLQDKTQVFPLGRNDYVRTRLTHSLGWPASAPPSACWRESGWRRKVPFPLL